MATLSVMQRYANKVADKLGLEEDSRPVLRWFAKPCERMGNNDAHCHVDGGTMPRGAICLGKGKILAVEGSWRKLVAHEVVHLRVKDHNSTAFRKWLYTLGQADGPTKRKLIQIAAIRHKHTWQPGYSTWEGEQIIARRYCSVCRKSQDGTITWKKA